MRPSRVAASVALAVGVGSAVAGCGGGSRITASVRPAETPTQAQCLVIAQRYAAGSQSRAQSLCNEAGASANWFHAKIAYAGGKSTWIACSVQGYDARSRKLWSNPWGLTLDPAAAFVGSTAVQMKPGTSLTVTWFLPGHQAGPVARYEPSCRTEPYPPA